MARMHSRKKGKSGSIKSMFKSEKSWIKYKPEEVIQLVEKLGKQDNNSSLIGLKLRDSYGIPNIKAITDKKITKILKEKELYPNIPEELENLIRKSIMIRKHLESNNKDKHSRRGLQLTESKIKRLVKYYKRKKVLDPKWMYTPEKAKLLIR